jgi:peptidoglycan/xylan/chitin deacetylase (PgdA/CDA1 family)
MRPLRAIERTFPRRLLGRMVAFLAIMAARCSSRRVGLAVVYHRVEDPQGDPRRELVPALGTQLFERQLQHLKSRYRVVPASEILTATLARRRGERFPVAISFDDDLPTHSRVASPILRRLGLPGAFFICGASLEARFAFWWERLQTAVDRGLDVRSLIRTRASGPRNDPQEVHALAARVQAMEPEERDAVAAALGALVGPDPPDAGMRATDVRKLAAAGFEIGFHTRRHDYLPRLHDGELERALTDGRDKVSAAAGSAVTMIAYPHGGADLRVTAVAGRARYGLGFTGSGEAVTPDTEPLLVGRLEPSFESLGHFAYGVARALMPRPRKESHRVR